jgi:hypothetical protein
LRYDPLTVESISQLQKIKNDI